MSLPFRPHLSWLIIEGQSDSDIVTFYSGIQFALPKYDYIESLRSRLAEDLRIPPSTKRNLLRSVYTAQDEAIWAKLGYRELYLHRVGKTSKTDQEAFSCLGKLLNHPVMRVALDCSLIARLTPVEAAEIIPQTFSLPLSLEAVELYRRYFLDLDRMSRTDWVYFLSQLKEDHYSYTRYYAALTRPQNEVMHLVGLPTKQQYTDFLRNVLATADFKFRHYARHGTPEGENESRKWAKIGIEAGEKQKKFESKDQGDLLRHIQTEFEYVDQQIPLATPELIAQMLPSPEDKTAPPKAPENPPAPQQNLNLGI